MRCWHQLAEHHVTGVVAGKLAKLAVVKGILDRGKRWSDEEEGTREKERHDVLPKTSARVLGDVDRTVAMVMV